jgi:ABC-type transport system substrate-binding protein
MILASGFTAIYPCYVPPRDMRSHPIGTGPFKFVEFKPNEYIKVTRNPDYWTSGSTGGGACRKPTAGPRFVHGWSTGATP